MIDLTPLITRAQIGGFLIIIFALLYYYFCIKLPVNQKVK